MISLENNVCGGEALKIICIIEQPREFYPSTEG